MACDELPEFIRTHYEVHEWKHACAILQKDFPAEWNDIVSVLTAFRLRRTHIETGAAFFEEIDVKLDVTHHQDHEEFTTRVNGDTAVLSYRTGTGRTLNYESTVVPERHRGRGVGSALVGYALDYARANGFRVIPTCPFVRRVIEQNPQYADLLAE